MRLTCNLLDKLDVSFEQGFVIETIWKFLIYTEITKSIYEKLKDKPIYVLSDNENDFLNFVLENKAIFLEDFSTRLEEQILKIKEQNLDGIKQSEFRIKIAEILHHSLFHKIKDFIHNLIGKSDKLIVMVDNLDKSWRKDGKIKIVSKFILGLLGVTGRISADLSVRKFKNKPLDFHLVIFLRSDIFNNILRFAREPDKLEITKLKWDDSEIIFKIIEERFIFLSSNVVTKYDLWEKYICKKVQGIPVKEYIENIVLPRPRDYIYFFKKAKDHAVSRGHSVIEENDLLSAYEDYSSWIFKSLIVENEISYNKMEDFMYKFLGEPCIISKSTILEFMESASFSESSKNLNDFINHLTSLSILGRRIKKDTFAFEYDFEDSVRYKLLSEKFDEQLFKIHNALKPYLMLED